MSLLEKFLKDGEYVIEHIGFDNCFSTAVALTNQRLLAIELEKEKKGFWKVQFTPKELKHNIPLESIKEVTYVPHGHIKLDLHILTDTEKIIQQIKERKERIRKKTPTLIDFSFLKAFIKKGGILLTTLKCPHCSAPIKMPKGGAETVCEHCGSTVYAQDIFEKVRKLME